MGEGPLFFAQPFPSISCQVPFLLEHVSALLLGLSLQEDLSFGPLGSMRFVVNDLWIKFDPEQNILDLVLNAAKFPPHVS